MHQRTILSAVLLLATTLTTGCTMFRKSRQPKESSAISSEVEENFHRRWVDKRSAELAAGGTASAEARAQAEKEFSERYDFSRAGRK